MQELEMYKLMLKGAVSEASPEERAVIDESASRTKELLDEIFVGTPDETKLKAIGLVLAAVDELPKLMETL